MGSVFDLLLEEAIIYNRIRFKVGSEIKCEATNLLGV